MSRLRTSRHRKGGLGEGLLVGPARGRDHRCRVSVVEPGTIKTDIWDKGDRAFEGLPEETFTLYRALVERGRALSRMFESQGIDPDKVAEKVEHALTARIPRTRYLVGIDAYVRAHVEARIPHRLRDAVVRRVVRH